MDTPLSERPLGLRDEINGRRRRSAADKRNTKKRGGDNSNVIKLSDLGARYGVSGP